LIKMGNTELLKPAQNICALCGLNGSSRKRVFLIHSGQTRLLVCSGCIVSLGSGAAVLQALEQKYPKLSDHREERFLNKQPAAGITKPAPTPTAAADNGGDQRGY